MFYLNDLSYTLSFNDSNFKCGKGFLVGQDAIMY